MDRHDGVARTEPPVEGRRLDGRPFVSLAEALTWIAFRDAMMPDHLRKQVEGHRQPATDTPKEQSRKILAVTDEDVRDFPGMGYFDDRQLGLEKLTEAWRQLRDDVDRGQIKMRGRLTSNYSLADARLAKVEELTGDILATFSQFDVSMGGLRRQPEGSPDVLWQNDSHSLDREIESFSGDARAASGYMLIEVGRVGLLSAHREGERGNVAANRSLNHEQIIGQAASMLAAQPSISKGSAAASIVADLPNNPTTGRPRDTRHVERMIAHLW